MKHWWLWGLCWWLVGCHTSAQEETRVIETKPVFPALDSIASLSGEQLAYRYCQACHTFPPPALLPKTIWTDRVLPRMGHRLGIRASLQEPYQGMSMYESFALRQAGIFPDTLSITEEGWQKIVDYYQQQAPDSLPSPPPTRNRYYAKHIPASGNPLAPIHSAHHHLNPLRYYRSSPVYRRSSGKPLCVEP